MSSAGLDPSDALLLLAIKLKGPHQKVTLLSVALLPDVAPRVDYAIYIE